MPRLRPAALSLAILSILLFSTLCLAAAPDRIASPIVPTQAVKLAASVPMQARQEFDQGAVDSSLKMTLTLLTVPSAAQQRALTKLLADQQNPASASYHQWLTPEQYADRFGLNSNDIAKLTAWLQSQGFSVVETARGRNWMVFTGTASQVESSFQTEVHNFKVNGKTRFANTQSPSIPTALSGIVTGLRGLNDFPAKSNAHRAQPDYTLNTGGSSFLFVAPGDISAIYDINTLIGGGTDGTGETLAVIGETDVYLDDLNNFRSGFNLSAVTGCSTNGNGVITTCSGGNFQYVFAEPSGSDPGSPNSLQDDLIEADIDLEWSNAVARKAKIAYVNAPLTGVWTAWYYAVDHKVAPVITMSYTTPCELFEAFNGGTGVGTYTSDEAELQKANSFGITFMNSSGDTGAAECDFGSNLAVVGYAIAYPASSPEVTGVGGTSIPAIAPNEYTSNFWNSSSDPQGGSAKGYIQEQPWNDAQEFGLVCTPSNPCTLNGSTVTNWQSAQNAIGISSGGGGISNCLTIDVNGVCNGGFARPFWQAGISASAINPSGAGETSTPARYSPDVSLLASPSFPGYIVCTAKSELGVAGNTSICSGGAAGILNMLTACVNRTGPCSLFGGTSISSPVFAGIVTLLNQYVVANHLQNTPGLGNVNPMLYSLAAANSTNRAFNPVTTPSTGSYTNGAWCQPGTPSSGVGSDPWPPALQCPSSGTNAGFLGFDAFNSDSTTGYNLVTGLGSVDVGNLFTAWVGASLASTTTAVASSLNPSNFGDSVTFTATVVTSGSNTPTGTVTFMDGSNSIGTAPLVAGPGVVTQATATLPPTSSLAPPSQAITAVYGGDSNNAGSTSAVLTQVVTAPTFTLTNPTSPGDVKSGQSTTSTFTVTPTSGSTFAGNVVLACSGLPATISCSFSTNPIPAGQPTTNETVTITTTGPNPNGGLRNQQHRRADNRLPWLPMTLPLAGVVVMGIAGRKRSKYSAVASMFLALALLGFLLACGSSSTPPAVGVSVSPSGSTLFPNNSADAWPPQTASFTATVTNATDTSVTWSLTSSAVCTANPSPCGTIDSTGAYTAPTIVAGLPGSVVAKATSNADSTKSGSATITLTPTTVPGPYTITIQATESTTVNTKSVTLNVN